LIPVSHADYFKRDIAGAKVEIVPDAGHLPHEEQADLVNTLISDFVKKGN
jgi:pimeloyl-ACP methyl ester carboxylesterase